MNIAAYCRVSTDKADQLNSLEAQKEFLRMMSDAEHGLFDMVVVKDISRFARNTVDLLQNVRKLKSLGIEPQFLTASNEIYTGKIINGKQEVSDFLTGQRKEKDETEWMVVERLELRIIDDETFEKAQQILHSRHAAFNMIHERQSNKYLFSTLIKCKECGWSFRRTVRTYKTTRPTIKPHYLSNVRIRTTAQ